MSEVSRPRCNERGSVILWVAILIGGVLGLFAGLAYDGGNAANTRVEIADAAWALARTAAAQTATSPNGDLMIDETDARTAIDEVATLRWPDMTWTLVVHGNKATVRVRGSYRTKILQVVGISQWDFESDRTATIETG